jgi:hypothetical protein
MTHVCAKFGDLARVLPCWNEHTTVDSVHQAVHTAYYNVALPDNYCLEIDDVKFTETHLETYREVVAQASPPAYIILVIKPLTLTMSAEDDQAIGFHTKSYVCYT